jgi:hypothetical protein
MQTLSIDISSIQIQPNRIFVEAPRYNRKDIYDLIGSGWKLLTERPLIFAIVSSKDLLNYVFKASGDLKVQMFGDYQYIGIYNCGNLRGIFASSPNTNFYNIITIKAVVR